MAWNRIQSASGASVATTVTATYGTALTHGTKLIAVCVTAGTGTANFTGVASGATTFTLLASANVAGTQNELSIWAVDSPGTFDGTTPVITATGSSAADKAILIQEVSGLATGTTLAAMVDGTPGVINAGSSTTTTGSPSYTSTAANEYLVAVYGDDGDGTTYTKPAALTDDAHSINTSGTDDLALAYGNSTNGAEAGTWALSGGTSPHWGALLLAFKLAAGGGGGAASPQVPAQPGLTWRRHFRHRQALMVPPPPALVTGTASLAGAGAVTASATAPGPPPQPSTAVFVARQPPGRARTGRGTVGAGIAVQALVPVLGFANLTGAGAVTAVVTQIASATAAAAGAVFAVPAGFVFAAPPPSVPVLVSQPRTGRARVGRGTVGGGIAVPPVTVTGAGTASIAGAAAVTAVVIQAATASLAGAGAVTAAVTQAAKASLTGAGALGPVPVTQIAGASLTAAGTTAANGLAPGQAPQPSTAVFVARQPPGRARTGRGTVGAGIAVQPLVPVIGFANLAGAGALNATGSAGGAATANLTGASTVTAVATVAAPMTAAGAGAITAAVTLRAAGTLTGAGSLSANGQIIGAANLAAAGAVTAKAIQAATAAPAGAAALAALATQAASAQLAGAGSLTAAGNVPVSLANATSAAQVTAPDTSAPAVGAQPHGTTVTEQASTRPGVSDG